mgnify:FL=1
MDTGVWTKIVTDGGTVAVADGAGGLLALSTVDSMDNDEVYVKSSDEAFLFAAGKPLHFKCRAKIVEANTDDINAMIGIANAVAADHLQDNGAGPLASYSGACFFKVDGGTVWQAESSVGGTQVTDTDVGTRDTSYHVFEILFAPTSTTAATVYFILDGALVASNAMTFTGATEMQICLGVKNGGANPEVMTVDYVYCEQAR